MAFFYMLRCRDQSLYCGWTVDLERRLAAHQTGKAGARYTRSRRPVELVHVEEFETQSDAMRREAEVKGWGKREKEGLVGV